LTAVIVMIDDSNQDAIRVDFGFQIGSYEIRVMLRDP